METRLRVGRAIAKTEEEVAPQLMQQVKRHAPEDPPPALSTDGKGAYREAMLETWGTVPQYGGQGRPPTVPQPGKDWQYLQVIKRRQGSKVVSVTPKVIYGEQEEVKKVLGEQTAYVERTHLTSRQMNGRLVRKTLSFSKELRFLKAASALEDGLYNFTRPLKTLRVEVETPSASMRWQQRTPAMAARLDFPHLDGEGAFDGCARSTSHQHLIGRLSPSASCVNVLVRFSVRLVFKREQITILINCLAVNSSVWLLPVLLLPLLLFCWPTNLLVVWTQLRVYRSSLFSTPYRGSTALLSLSSPTIPI